MTNEFFADLLGGWYFPLQHVTEGTQNPDASAEYQAAYQQLCDALPGTEHEKFLLIDRLDDAANAQFSLLPARYFEAGVRFAVTLLFKSLSPELRGLTPRKTAEEPPAPPSPCLRVPVREIPVPGNTHGTARRCRASQRLRPTVPD